MRHVLYIIGISLCMALSSNAYGDDTPTKRIGQMPTYQVEQPEPERQVHYDYLKRRTGHSIDRGDRQIHYDRMGRRTGHSINKNDRQIHYDRMGRRTGSTTGKR